jgi:hypothetical protein
LGVARLECIQIPSPDDQGTDLLMVVRIKVQVYIPVHFRFAAKVSEKTCRYGKDWEQPNVLDSTVSTAQGGRTHRPAAFGRRSIRLGARSGSGPRAGDTRQVVYTVPCSGKQSGTGGKVATPHSRAGQGRAGQGSF